MVTKCCRDLLSSNTGESRTAAAYLRLTCWPYSRVSIFGYATLTVCPAQRNIIASAPVRSTRALDFARRPASVPPTNSALNPGWAADAANARINPLTRNRQIRIMTVGIVVRQAGANSQKYRDVDLQTAIVDRYGST